MLAGERKGEPFSIGRRGGEEQQEQQGEPEEEKEEQQEQQGGLEEEEEEQGSGISGCSGCAQLGPTGGCAAVAAGAGRWQGSQAPGGWARHDQRCHRRHRPTAGAREPLSEGAWCARLQVLCLNLVAQHVCRRSGARRPTCILMGLVLHPWLLGHY